jgi:hypothetical protein
VKKSGELRRARHVACLREIQRNIWYENLQREGTESDLGIDKKVT